MSVKNPGQTTEKAKLAELTEEDLDKATGGAGATSFRQSPNSGARNRQDENGNPNFEQFEDFAP